MNQEQNQNQIEAIPAPAPPGMGPNAPLIALATGQSDKAKSDPYAIPPITMTTLLLLSEINSPFVRQAVPETNEDGSPKMENGRPVFLKEEPTLVEMVQAFYIVTNQDHPNILEIISDELTFKRTILEFGKNLNMEAINRIGAGMNREMSAVNEAGTALNGEGGPGAKKATGPMQQSGEFCPPAAAALTKSATG